jgi:hypothetical protein
MPGRNPMSVGRRGIEAKLMEVDFSPPERCRQE